MAIIITGKQIDLGESLTDSIRSDIESVVGKHFDGEVEANVTVTKDSVSHFKTDILVHIGRHIDIHCVGGDDDPHKSAAAAISKLETQIRRYKTRLIEKRRKKDDHSQIAEKVQKFIVEAQKEDTHDDNPVIIAELASEIHSLSVGDAVMKLDLSAHPALVFRNVNSGELNVVFRRADGNIGWIDPSLKLA